MMSSGVILGLIYIYICHSSHYYLVVGLEHFLFFHILGIIIPTDFHIFQLKPPVIHDGNSVLSQPGQ